MKLFPGKLVLLLAASLLLSEAAYAAPIVIDFEGLPGMVLTSGSVVPVSSQLSDQFASTWGIVFSSTSGYVSVVNLGTNHAISGVNGIGGSTADGKLSYSSDNPITISFWDPSNPTIKATTDFILVRGDLVANSGENATLSAYDVSGALITSTTMPDVAGQTWSISAPNIHSIIFGGVTIPDGEVGGIALDDVTFHEVTPVPEPASIFLLGSCIGCYFLRRSRS